MNEGLFVTWKYLLSLAFCVYEFFFLLALVLFYVAAWSFFWGDFGRFSGYSGSRNGSYHVVDSCCRPLETSLEGKCVEHAIWCLRVRSAVMVVIVVVVVMVAVPIKADGARSPRGNLAPERMRAKLNIFIFTMLRCDVRDRKQTVRSCLSAGLASLLYVLLSSSMRAFNATSWLC